MDNTTIQAPALEKMRSALLSIKFSNEEIDYQLKELNELISLSILSKLLEQHPAQGLTPETLPQFLQAHENDPNLAQIIRSESARIMEEYVMEIADSLPEQDRAAFFSYF